MIIRVEVEDDLAAQVEVAARTQGIQFDAFVASALGVAVSQAQLTAPGPFVQKVHDFGTHLESPWSLLADLETSAAQIQR
ncbi:MAG TPA: hypothetical protein VF773_21530 [Verrucomicrobiae bacterium]